MMQAAILQDELIHASKVRDNFADTLNRVAQGNPVTVPRQEGASVTMVRRDSYIDLIKQNAQLLEVLEVCHALHYPQIRKGVKEAEKAIEKGEWLSFEEAFDESL